MVEAVSNSITVIWEHLQVFVCHLPVQGKLVHRFVFCKQLNFEALMAALWASIHT